MGHTKKKLFFFSKIFFKFLAFFMFFAQKTLKITILISIWSVQHPNTFSYGTLSMYVQQSGYINTYTDFSRVQTLYLFFGHKWLDPCRILDLSFVPGQNKYNIFKKTILMVITTEGRCNKRFTPYPVPSHLTPNFLRVKSFSKVGPRV